MKHGFIKTAAVTPDIRVADVAYNTESIIKNIDEAKEAGARIIVFPELCITGYTCGDLFTQEICLQTPEKPFTGSPLIQKKWTPWCLWAYRLP